MTSCEESLMTREQRFRARKWDRMFTLFRVQARCVVPQQMRQMASEDIPNPTEFTNAEEVV